MNTDKTGKIIQDSLNNIIEEAPEIIKTFGSDASLSKGKHLRARTLLAFADRKTGRTLKIAVAIELLHTATLIHDDILDNSIYRRGAGSLHVRHGITEGTLYGDYLFAEGLLILSELKDPVFFKEAAKALSLTLEGEIIETERRCGINLTEQEYLATVTQKSGIFLGMVCKLGAIARGASAHGIRQACRFGIKAGTAYQILDDYNDYFNGSASGKKKFSDMRNKIVTLPLIYMLNIASKEERAHIEKTFQSGKQPASGLDSIQQIMIKHGIPEKVLAKSGEYIKDALSCLPYELETATMKNFNILHYIEKNIADERKKYNYSRNGVRGKSRVKQIRPLQKIY